MDVKEVLGSGFWVLGSGFWVLGSGQIKLHRLQVITPNCGYRHNKKASAKTTTKETLYSMAERQLSLR